MIEKNGMIERAVASYNQALKDYRKTCLLLTDKSNFDETTTYVSANTCANSLYTSVESVLKIFIQSFDPNFSIEKVDSIAKLCNLASKYLTSNEQIDLNTLVIEKYARNRLTHQCIMAEIQGFSRVFKNLRSLILLLNNTLILDDSPGVSQGFNFNNYYDEINFKDARNNTLVLITDSLHDFNDDEKSLLANINWDIVIDFDPHTYEKGLRKYVDEDKKIFVDYKVDKNADTSVLNDSILSSNKKAWLTFISNDSVIPALYKNWKIPQKRFLEELPRNSFNSKTTRLTIVCMKRYDPGIRFIIEKFRECYDEITCIFVNQYEENTTEKLNEILDEDEYTVYYCDLTTVLSEMMKHKRLFEIDTVISNDQIVLPCRDGMKVIKNNLRVNLEDYFEILHINTRTNRYDVDEARVQFLSGNETSWDVFENSFDVNPIEKDTYDKFIGTIEDSLRSKSKQLSDKIYHILHRPGFGGSTLLKRVAWDFHSKYPVLILKKYSRSMFNQMITQLYDFSMNGILIIADEDNISKSDIEDLEVEAKNIDRPVAILIAKRIYDLRKKSSSKRDLRLTVLSDNAILKLSKIYKSHAKKMNVSYSLDDKEENMLRVLKNDMLCPFIIGLYFLDEKFRGIDDYVDRFINSVNDNTLKEALLFVAFTDYYGRLSIPQILITRLLGGRSLNGKSLSTLGNSLELMVSYEEQNTTVWRIKHYLISKEIISKLLLGSSDGNYKDKLLNYGSKHIDIILNSCKNSIPKPFSEILSEVYINNRIDTSCEQFCGETTNADRQFSLIVNEIPLKEEKLEMLKNLAEKTDIFINKLNIEKAKEEYALLSHVWGHLARYYSSNHSNYEKAEEACKKALFIMENLKKENASIYHIYGDCFSKRASYEMDRLKEVSPVNWTDDLENIESIIENAEHYYRLSKNYGNVEYSIISHAKLLLKYIENVIFFEKTNDLNKLIIKSKTKIAVYILKVKELLDSLDEEEISNNALMRYQALIIKYSELVKMESAGTIIQDLNNYLDNQLKKTVRDSNKIFITRKNIINFVFSKYEWDYTKLGKNEKACNRILELLDQNIDDNYYNSYDCNMWMRIAKYMDRSLEDGMIIARKWLQLNLDGGVLDPRPNYYLYVLSILRNIDGFTNGVDDAVVYRKECLRITKMKQRYSIVNSVKVRDWFGRGKGMKRLIDDRDVDLEKFKGIEDVEFSEGKFVKCNERLTEGYIDLTYPRELSQLSVYFKPIDASLTQNQLHHTLKFNFGFSFERPSAYNKSIDDVNKERPNIKGNEKAELERKKVVRNNGMAMAFKKAGLK